MSSAAAGGSRTEWPQSLKDFANRVFQTCNDSNRKMVSEELKTVIFQSFQAGTINTTDWNNVQLKSLGSVGGSAPVTPIKKGKKRMLGSVGSPTGLTSGGVDYSNGHSSSSASRPGSSSGVFEEEDKREKRARRFEEEKRAFVAEQESSWSEAAPSSAISLAGRLGGASLGVSGGKKNGKARKEGWHADSASSTPTSGWTYDPSPSSGMAGKGWTAAASGSGSSLAARGFVDESIADPVSQERAREPRQRDDAVICSPWPHRHLCSRMSSTGTWTQSSGCPPSWRSPICVSLLLLIPRRYGLCRYCSRP